MKKWIRLLIICLFAFFIFHMIESNFASDSPTTETERHTNGNAAAEDELNIAAEEEPEPAFKIVIDPGHGGEDPGATGASGSYEKDFNLSLSLKVVRLLEQIPDLEVRMTREDDTFLSSESRERTNFANDLGADLFVSIHANTFTSPTVTGTETFYYSADSERLAQVIHQHVVRATGFHDRGITEESYFVLTDTYMPAVLLEIGYITNPIDEQKMLTDEFQQKVAEAIAAGIKEYLEIE